MSFPLLTIIIPALDEEVHLALLLDDLACQRGLTSEVIVCDGGSSDSTCAVAAARQATVVHSGRGRGVQMNRGVAQANGSFLLFLHADSRLPHQEFLADAVAAFDEQLQRSGDDRCAGHFPVRFHGSTSGHDQAYRYLEAKSALNRPGTTNGDQGLLICKEFLSRLGGFDETLPYLEDQRLADRILSCGRLITLPGHLITSARRFEIEGFSRRYLLMGLMMVMQAIGAESFFHRAPGVYRAQGSASSLRLCPFLRIVVQMMREEWGIRGSIEKLYRSGRYLRENIWQLFFFTDVQLERIGWHSRGRFLKVYDRLLGRLLDSVLVNALLALVCGCTLLMLMPLCFRQTGD